jgi:hypothetical protein
MRKLSVSVIFLYSMYVFLVLVQNVLPQNVLHYKTSFLQNVISPNVLPQNVLPQNAHLYKTSSYTKRPPLQNVLPRKHPSLQNVLQYKKFPPFYSTKCMKSIVQAIFLNSSSTLQGNICLHEQYVASNCSTIQAW